MSSIADVCAQVCTHQPPLIAVSRHKDVKTAVKYLASAYGTPPEKLTFTPAIEAGYREALRAYFDQHPKGHSTVRNTLNFLAALWKAYHTLDRTPLVPRPAPRVPGVRASIKRLTEDSPYRHLRWLQQTGRYGIPPAQWPQDITTHWDAFALACAHDMRWVTFDNYQKSFGYYVSYHLMSPADRWAALPGEAQAKLQTEEKYASWRREITAPPIVTAWDELFEPARLNSYITWSTWRCWRWHDEILKEKEPHRPSSRGQKVAFIVRQIAKRTDHPAWSELNALCRKLQNPLSMHDKTATRHRFEFSELEAVALKLIAEARRMRIKYNLHQKHPGLKPSLRFQLGLLLQLAWRNPMRARNWCEALLGHNLKQDQQGQWRWRFVGEEMKIGRRERGTQVNVFEPDVPADVTEHLNEFLSTYRPHLPNASTDRHVFLSQSGRPMKPSGLRTQLAAHVHRYTGKRMYTHLLRSLFSTHHLGHGMDINSVAYAMNDTPASVLKAYNQLVADTHRPIIAEANRQALANGHKPLTPPLIPVIPKPRPTNPDQIPLL
jgi:hypothetical protein